MKHRSIPQTLVVGCLLVVASSIATAADPPKVKRVNAEPAVSNNGADLFRQYCAACHGPEGRGNGPAAEALKKSPVDLTQLTRKNNGKFPELRIQNYIKGDTSVTAHGTREMPVWGTIFKSMNNRDEMTTLRVAALVKHIEAFQAK